MKIAFVLIAFHLLSSGTFCYEDNDDLPIIEVSTGFLRVGYRELSHSGTTYTAFEGVPYARPPVGELRFQAPKEPYNWTGVWIADTKYSCVPFGQTPTYLTMPAGEDCLYLNIYVPSEEPSSEDKFDVVVHFHSGSFTVGHPHVASGPKFLLDEEDIIYVSMSYRLGPLGFLSTEDEVLPGNYGLKDQTMALKWIQKNIKYFGGNPDSVTLTGSSSGGASVHYHYLSSLSKGLFHRGYSGSGTVLDPWSLQDSPLEKAKYLAVLLGCNPITSQDILNCVMQRSTQSIFDATQNFFYQGMPFSPFGPVIEIKHEGAFLDQHPYKQLTHGPVHDLPWIVVINEDEGMFPAGSYYNYIETMSDDWEKFAPHLFDYNYTTMGIEKDSISRKIKQYYFEDQPVSFSKLVQACGDRHFFQGAKKSVGLQSKLNKSPVYMLMFAYKGDFSYSNLFGIPILYRGVAHGDDSLYYLSSNMVYTVSKNDTKMKDIMVKIIATFAKHNSPNVEGIEWKPIKGDKMEYLYLDGFEHLQMKEAEDLSSPAFWETLKLKENENYFSTSRDEL